MLNQYHKRNFHLNFLNNSRIHLKIHQNRPWDQSPYLDGVLDLQDLLRNDTQHLGATVFHIGGWLSSIRSQYIPVVFLVVIWYFSDDVWWYLTILVRSYLTYDLMVFWGLYHRSPLIWREYHLQKQVWTKRYGDYITIHLINTGITISLT